MRAIVATVSGDLAVQAMARPEPRDGDVLVRVICSPVNPADRLQIAGAYVHNPARPFVPGLVGVGRVVDVGRAGAWAGLLEGRRVVFGPGPEREGAWAEFAAAPALRCLPLPEDLADADAVNVIANGLTAVGLLAEIRSSASPAVILSAAAGDLARLVAAGCRAAGIAVVHLVRRPDQADGLDPAGADRVVVSEAETFAADLSAAVRATGARFAVDAVAGPLTARLLGALPPGSRVVVTGALASPVIQLHVMGDLIGRGQTLSAFNVNLWLARQTPETLPVLSGQAVALVRAAGGVRVRRRVGLDEAVAGYAAWVGGQSEGKTLIYPDRT